MHQRINAIDSSNTHTLSGTLQSVSFPYVVLLFCRCCTLSLFYSEGDVHCLSFILQVKCSVSLLFFRCCTLCLFSSAGAVHCVSFVLQVLYTVSLCFCRWCTLCLFCSEGAVHCAPYLCYRCCKLCLFYSAGAVHCVFCSRCCTLCLFYYAGAVHCFYRGDSGLPHEVQRLSPGQADLQVFGNAHHIHRENKYWERVSNSACVGGGVLAMLTLGVCFLKYFYYR